MELIAETKKNHIWRKIVWQTNPDEFPLGPRHYAEIYCCEEANGYTIWYVRKLAKDQAPGRPDVDSGDYLLDYFSRNRRDDAIERAVLIANSAPTAEDVIKALDALAASAKKV